MNLVCSVSEEEEADIAYMACELFRGGLEVVGHAGSNALFAIIYLRGNGRESCDLNEVQRQMSKSLLRFMRVPRSA